MRAISHKKCRSASSSRSSIASVTVSFTRSVDATPARFPTMSTTSFALLCEGLGIRAECAVEDSPRSKAKRAIDARCLLVPCDEDPCGRFRVVSKGASSDAATVLGRLDFGMLDVNKVEAKRVAQESGWMSVMRRTWFCHAPMNGKPCGICNPCKDAMAEGMSWRMPLSSRLRYYAWRLRSATAMPWRPRNG